MNIMLKEIGIRIAGEATKRGIDPSLLIIGSPVEERLSYGEEESWQDALFDYDFTLAQEATSNGILLLCLIGACAYAYDVYISKTGGRHRDR